MKLEPIAYAVLIVALSGAVLAEGSRHAELQRHVALTPKQLYGKLSRSQVKLQLVDVRSDLSEFDDSHVPGAVPFPGCDPAKLPTAAQGRVYAYVPTVVISADGDRAAYEACLARFTTSWNLAGGMSAWSDANLPEDSGEYVAPRSAAGGGCL